MTVLITAVAGGAGFVLSSLQIARRGSWDVALAALQLVTIVALLLLGPDDRTALGLVLLGGVAGALTVMALRRRPLGVMGRHQDEAAARSDAVERTEDRGMPDRVRMLRTRIVAGAE